VSKDKLPASKALITSYGIHMKKKQSTATMTRMRL